MGRSLCINLVQIRPLNIRSVRLGCEHIEETSARLAKTLNLEQPLCERLDDAKHLVFGDRAQKSKRPLKAVLTMMSRLC